jgi:hypothetical protein
VATAGSVGRVLLSEVSQRQQHGGGNSWYALGGIPAAAARRRQQLVLVVSPDLRELMGGERENGEGVLRSSYWLEGGSTMTIGSCRARS